MGAEYVEVALAEEARFLLQRVKSFDKNWVNVQVKMHLYQG